MTRSSLLAPLLASLAGVALITTAVRAEAADARTEDLFEGAAVLTPTDPTVARQAERAVARVAEVCHAPAGERMGASASEVVACNAAVSALVKQGKAATAAILAQLDDQRTPWFARLQIRDALGRSGDDSAVATLVKAAERSAAREAGGVSSEVSSNDVQEILEQATFDNPADKAPWEGDATAVKATDESAKGMAVAWRGWLDQNPRPDGGYRKAGEAKARAEAAGSDVAKAYLAARRLVKHRHTRATGIAALRRLHGRSDLPKGAGDAVEHALEDAGVDLPQPRKPAPPAAPSKSKVSPPTGARSLADRRRSGSAPSRGGQPRESEDPAGCEPALASTLGRALGHAAGEAPRRPALSRRAGGRPARKGPRSAVPRGAPGAEASSPTLTAPGTPAGQNARVGRIRDAAPGAPARADAGIAAALP